MPRPSGNPNYPIGGYKGKRRLPMPADEGPLMRDYETEGDMTVVDKVARAIYEADDQGGYDADDPKTFWMAADGYWPPATKMCVWDAWRNIARAAIAVMPQKGPADAIHLDVHSRLCATDAQEATSGRFATR